MTLNIRPFHQADLEAVIDIAIAAWQPIFASLREMVGDNVFDHMYTDHDAQKRTRITVASRVEDPRLIWVAELDGEIAGFIIIDMNHDTLVAEIGNNAVSPEFQHRGIGTQMYTFVLERMKESGMKAAVVTTGGDPEHAPARRAYEKTGFAGPVPSVEYHLEL